MAFHQDRLQLISEQMFVCRVVLVNFKFSGMIYGSLISLRRDAEQATKAGAVMFSLGGCVMCVCLEVCFIIIKICRKHPQLFGAAVSDVQFNETTAKTCQPCIIFRRANLQIDTNRCRRFFIALLFLMLLENRCYIFGGGGDDKQACER